MKALSDNPQFLELIFYFGPKLLFAVLCGGIIGLERELKNKAAGIKTNMLICVGAALYTSMSVLIASRFSSNYYFGDPGRIAAQIVSGIGFLGGGAIIQSRGNVVGLTTAATIWVVAAIGIMIGLGYEVLAVTGSLLVVCVLVAITFLENRFIGRSNYYACEVVSDAEESKLIVRKIKEALEKYDLDLIDLDSSSEKKNSIIKVKYEGLETNHKSFLIRMWAISGVKQVRKGLLGD